MAIYRGALARAQVVHPFYGTKLPIYAARYEGRIDSYHLERAGARPKSTNSRCGVWTHRDSKVHIPRGFGHVLKVKIESKRDKYSILRFSHRFDERDPPPARRRSSQLHTCSPHSQMLRSCETYVVSGETQAELFHGLLRSFSPRVSPATSPSTYSTLQPQPPPYAV